MNEVNPLREMGREEKHPQPRIEESIRGVSFDYYFTGKRRGPSGQIELHLTSVVRDWQEKVYIRRAWFMGHKQDWQGCIRRFIADHLLDLDTGHLLVKRMMQEFEVSNEKYVPWERYHPVKYGLYD